MEEIARLEIKAVSDDLVKANKRLDALEKQAPKTERKVFSLTGTLGRFVSTAALVAAGTAAMWSAFDNIRSGERLNAMLKTATGSALGARIAFAELTDTATKMPGTLEDLTAGFIKLTNLGIDASERALLSFGNTSSAMGKSLNDFIEAVADAATAEFERLKEFGIRASNQGDVIKFTFRGVTKTVENSSEAITEYLTRMGEVEFAGSMAEQMDTIDGKLANLNDAWFRFTQRIENKEWVKDLIDGATQGLDALTDRDIVGDIAKRAYNNPSSLDVSDIPALKKLQEEETKRLLRYGFVFGNAGKVSQVGQLIKQLEAEKEIIDAKEAQLELDRKIADGKAGLEDFDYRRAESARREVDTAYNILSIEQEIAAVRERLASGNGSTDANLKRLEKLQDELDKAVVGRGRDAVTAKDRYQSFFDDAKTELEILQDKQASEFAYVQAHKDLLFANEERYQEALTELEREHERERREIGIQGLTGRLGAAKAYFDKLTLLNQGESEKLFRIQKGFALADAIVSGAKAINKAWGSAAFPANLPAVAMTTAETGIQVANIKSQSFAGNYTGGGILGGNHFYGDRMNFNGNRGEMVLNYPQQKELFEIATGKKTSGQQKNGYGLNIEVHNYSGEKVKTEQSLDGKTVRFIVGEAVKQVNAEILEGTRTARNLQGVYGLRRGGR